MKTLKDLNNETIQTGWDNKEMQSTAADAFYEYQQKQLLRDGFANRRLPFFETEPKDPPTNVLNRNAMKDVNKTMAETHAFLLGAKTNEYVFGADLVALGLSLDKTKNMTPLLVASRNQFNNLDNPVKGEMNVKEEGLAARLKTEDRFFKKEHGQKRVDYQFMYNVEQLDPRSLKKLRQVTKPEQEKHKEKRDHEKQEARKNWNENRTEYSSLVKENLDRDRQHFSMAADVMPIYNAIMLHEMAQRQGVGVGSIYKSAAGIEKAYQNFGKALDNLDIESRDNPNIRSDILLDASMRGTKMGEKLTSKEISFEDKRRRDEHRQRMENVHGISR